MPATLSNSRSWLTKKCDFAPLLVLVVVLAAGAPASAADPIKELLEQDEISGELRRDLNALTEEQWEYYFKVGRQQPHIELGGQQVERESESHLIERESEKPIRVLYVWFAAVAAGFGMAIGAIKAWPFVRHEVLTLAVPVHMKDPSFASLAALTERRWRGESEKV